MPRGLAVVLVGPDGSGKTTIARRLLETLPRSRYVYLGTATQSANYALPTSRWILALKLRLGGAQRRADVPVRSDDAVLQGARYGRFAKALGLLNRLADECYRQLVVAWFVLRGFVVVCDRHFLFEYLPHSPSYAHRRAERARRFSDRLHLWCVKHLYPRPAFVLYLAAPAQTLFERKGEWSLDHLRLQALAIEEQGAMVAHFARIDASRPAESVLAAVRAAVLAQAGQAVAESGA